MKTEHFLHCGGKKAKTVEIEDEGFLLKESKSDEVIDCAKNLDEISGGQSRCNKEKKYSTPSMATKSERQRLSQKHAVEGEGQAHDFERSQNEKDDVVSVPDLINEDEEDGQKDEAEKTEDEEDEISIPMTPAGPPTGGGSTTPYSSAAAPAPARRTPGANVMHRSKIVNQQQQRSASLRRTPGATSMHRSMGDNIKEEGGRTSTAHRGDPAMKGAASNSTKSDSASSSVLGFGLTLSTPVGATSSKALSRDSFSSSAGGGAAGISCGAGDDGAGCIGKGDNGGRTNELIEEIYEASSSTASEASSSPNHRHSAVTPLAHGGKSFSQARRPPLDPNGAPTTGRERHYTYTPSSLSLSKNPHLNIVEGTDGTFSPNTIRLTESLDNLLHEDDNDNEAPCEDWSKAYTFENNNIADAARRKGLKAATDNNDGKKERRETEENEDEDNSSTGSSSSTNSKPRPLNFTDPGRRGGAFIPPSTIINNGNEACSSSFHAPTPKKPHPSTKTSQKSTPSSSNNQNSTVDELPATTPQIVIHHHHHYSAYPPHPQPQQHTSHSPPRNTAISAATSSAQVNNAELFPYHVHHEPPPPPHPPQPTIAQYGYEHPYNAATVPLTLYPPHGAASPINIPTSSSPYHPPLPDHHHPHYAPHPPPPMHLPFPPHPHHHPISSLALQPDAQPSWHSHTQPQSVSTNIASRNQYASDVMAQRDSADVWHATNPASSSNTGPTQQPTGPRNDGNTDINTWEQPPLIDTYHGGSAVSGDGRNLPPPSLLGHISPTPILGHMSPSPPSNSSINLQPPPQQYWEEYNDHNHHHSHGTSSINDITSITASASGSYRTHPNHCSNSGRENGGGRESSSTNQPHCYSTGSSHTPDDGNYETMNVISAEKSRGSHYDDSSNYQNQSHGQPKRRRQQQRSQNYKPRSSNASSSKQQKQQQSGWKESVSSSKEHTEDETCNLQQQQQKIDINDEVSIQRNNHRHNMQQQSIPPNRKQRHTLDQSSSSKSPTPKNCNNYIPKSNSDASNIITKKTRTSPKKKSATKTSPKDKKFTATSNSSNSSSPFYSINKGKIDPVLDAENIKRAELVESPGTRLLFKEFSRKFRSKERVSLEKAQEFATKCLQMRQDHDDNGEDYVQLPHQIHWRVYLELADLAKRNNDFKQARKLYRIVIDLQPYASQGWLEYSKLEEESGKLHKCASILHQGLSYCHDNEQQHSENLLTRAIKHEERMGNLGKARQLLGRLKSAKIERVWRTVLEGALLEGRAGNFVMARRVLKYLMHHVPWYGPLYLEAYRLEERYSSRSRPHSFGDDNYDDYFYSSDALTIVERGLKEIPRYGPLWFGAFRMCEAIDISTKKFDLPHTMAMMERATQRISRELLWKVHFESAQVQERAAILSAEGEANEGDDNGNASLESLTISSPSLNDRFHRCRICFARTVLACPPNLCWKVWLAGGRMELIAGRVHVARKLFLRAYEVVPEKGRAAVLLECARLEEFDGDTDLARAILCKARHTGNCDWKVWIESVSVEVRSGERERAIHLSRMALEIHAGTGRLWAALLQLLQPDGEFSQYVALKSALRAVPKSGEVWCEGARIHLNPFVPTFDLNKAAQHLTFATKFTPQYGDSFIETLRHELLDKWIAAIALPFVKELEEFILGNESTVMDIDGVHGTIGNCVRKAFFQILQMRGIFGDKEKQKGLSQKSLLVSNLNENDAALVDTSNVELRCSNADPNYGLLWFHCRKRPTDTAHIVLLRAKKLVASDIFHFAHFYVAAMVRRAGVVLAIRREQSIASSNGKVVSDSAMQRLQQKQSSIDNVMETGRQWDYILEEGLRAAPLLEDFLVGLNEYQNDLTLLESDTSGSDFVTGLVELNRHQQLDSLSLIERRKVLFGSDSLLS